MKKSLLITIIACALGLASVNATAAAKWSDEPTTAGDPYGDTSGTKATKHKHKAKAKAAKSADTAKAKPAKKSKKSKKSKKAPK